jgi:hypothetical protein
LEPWGFEAEDLRAGILASSMYGAMGTKTKPADFMLRRGDEPVEPADQVAALNELFGVANK